MGRTACTEPQWLYKGALYLTLPLYWWRDEENSKVEKKNWIEFCLVSRRMTRISIDFERCVLRYCSITLCCDAANNWNMQSDSVKFIQVYAGSVWRYGIMCKLEVSQHVC